MWKTMKERQVNNRISLLLLWMTSIATALSPPSRGFMDLPFAWLLVLFVHFWDVFHQLSHACVRQLPYLALSGVYAKDVHVRMACLNAVKCIPALAGHSIPENIEVATSIWLALLHDPEKLQLDPTHEWMKCLPMEKKKQNFYERMTYEIERLQNLDINDADLIFFPVLRHGHYFLICINVKASKLEIIDNKSLVRGVTMKDKYGDCTTLLVTALKEYLALGSSALFWKVDELTEEVVDMSWKESENYIDCGLFVMRHMETYKGTLKKWNPGFRKKARLNEDFLIGLRARYAATIIRWRANTLKNILIKKTKLLYNKK